MNIWINNIAANTELEKLNNISPSNCFINLNEIRNPYTVKTKIESNRLSENLFFKNAELLNKGILNVLRTITTKYDIVEIFYSDKVFKIIKKVLYHMSKLCKESACLNVHNGTLRMIDLIKSIYYLFKAADEITFWYTNIDIVNDKDMYNIDKPLNPFYNLSELKLKKIEFWYCNFAIYNTENDEEKKETTKLWLKKLILKHASFNPKHVLEITLNW